jgi:hypothetical protein
MPKTTTTNVTLEETVASQAAELLIKAAEAREKANAAAGKGSELLGVAETLESDAAKWERRLRWWKFLQQNRRPKEA